jgi:hypothetical protein
MLLILHFSPWLMVWKQQGTRDKRFSKIHISYICYYTYLSNILTRLMARNDPRKYKRLGKSAE